MRATRSLHQGFGTGLLSIRMSPSKRGAWNNGLYRGFTCFPNSLEKCPGVPIILELLNSCTDLLVTHFRRT